MLNSTLKPIKWHLNLCNTSRCISQISGCSVDCSDIRSTAHLSTSSCHASSTSVKRGRNNREEDEIQCACLCWAVKQNIENTQRPKAVCDRKEYKKMRLRLRWNVACTCKRTVTAPRRIKTKKNNWQTGLIDGNITKPYRLYVVCLINMNNSNHWKKKDVGNMSIVHIPTAHSDDITDSSVSFPVCNVAMRQ